MSPFQIIILAALAIAAVTLVIGLVHGRVGRLSGTVFLVVLAAGAVAAVDPDLTTAVARRLGIRRGADLLLYLLVLAVLQGFLVVYLKLRHLRREMTQLVRRIAIREAERAAAPSRDGGHGEA